jgi:hypothetical protein
LEFGGSPPPPVQDHFIKCSRQPAQKKTVSLKKTRFVKGTWTTNPAATFRLISANRKLISAKKTDANIKTSANMALP